MSKESFISLREVSKNFKVSGGLLRAVNKVSFDINKGETLGLVGESGCGKSTLGRLVMGVYQPSEGEIIVKGESLHIKSQNDRYK